jgi:preprotein translocase subunit SecA
MVTRSIESAQRKVEGQELRHPQAAARVRRRRQRPAQGDLRAAQHHPRLAGRVGDDRGPARRRAARHAAAVHPEDSIEEQWDIAGLERALKAELLLELPLSRWLDEEPELQPEALLERIVARAEEAYRAKVPAGAEASFHQYERYMVLQILDAHWREHLAALDHLRQGIHLRGYAQKNPKQEYKREAFELFGAMVEAVKLEVTKTLTAIEIRTQNDVPKPDDQSHVENVRQVHPSSVEAAQTEPEENGEVAVAEAPKQRPVRVGQKVGRNDPCPCGSGKKYKQCHGKLS